MHWSARGLMVLIILCCLGMAGLRALAFTINLASAPLAHWLLTPLQGELAAEKLHFSLHYLDPRVDIEDLTLSIADVPVVEIASAAIQLDLWESFARGGPVFRAAHANQVSIQLSLEDGQLSLLGIPAQEPGAVPWRALLRSDRVAFSELAITLHSGDRVFDVIQFAAIHSASEGDQYDVHVQWTQNDGYLEFGTQLHGNIDVPLSWRGALSARASNFTLTPWLDLVQAVEAVDFESLFSQVTFDDGRLSAQALGSASAILRGAPIELEDTRWSAHGHTHDGFAVSGSMAAFTVGGEPVFQVSDAPININVNHEKLVAEVPAMRFNPLLNVLLKYRLLPEVQHRWMSNTAPSMDLGPIRVWVDDDGYALATQFSDLYNQSYKGAPAFSDAVGTMYIGPGSVTVSLPGTPMSVGFPELFEGQSVAYDSVQARVSIFHRPGHISIEGRGLELHTGRERISGAFDFWRPDDPLEQVVMAHVELADAYAERLKNYIPVGLSQELRSWLRGALVDGTVSNGELFYHGHVKDAVGSARRHTALHATLRDAGFSFDKQWPLLELASANMALDSRGVSGAGIARLGDGEVHAHSVVLPKDSLRVQIQGSGAVDAEVGTRWLMASPVASSLEFMNDGWQISGPMSFDYEASVPIVNAAGSAGLPESLPKISVRSQVDALQLFHQPSDLVVNRFTAAVDYEFPAVFHADRFTAEFLGQDITGSISTEQIAGHSSSTAPGVSTDVVRVRFEGLAEVIAIHDWLDLSFLNLSQGSVSYSGHIELDTDAQVGPSISMMSDLQGLAIDLPPPFEKLAEQQWPGNMTVQFAPFPQGVTEEDATFLLTSDEAEFTVHAQLDGRAALLTAHRGDVMTRGDLSLDDLSVSLPVQPFLRVRGSLQTADAAQWLALGDAFSVVSESPVEQFPGQGLGLTQVADEQSVGLWLDDIEIGSLLALGQAFRDTRLSAWQTFVAGDDSANDAVAGEFWQVELENQAMLGRIDVAPSGALDVLMDRLDLSWESDEVAAADSEVVALRLEDLEVLPPSHFSVTDLSVNGEHYGQLSFDLEVDEMEMRAYDIKGELRALQLGGEPPEKWAGLPTALTWYELDGRERTRFSGVIQSEDLAATQEAWGLADSVKAEHLIANIALHWEGDPTSFSVEKLLGPIDARLSRGTMAQVETGSRALKFLGLFNFNALLRRARLDFADVTSKGLSFDVIDAQMSLASGMLKFREPAVMVGTGSEIKISGEVNLVTGELDNEMVVTLPVSRNMPWYATYAALVATPLAGAGVMVAQRVLKNQIDQASSARYRVSGTLDAPVMKFDSLFDMPAVSTDTEAVNEIPSEINSRPDASAQAEDVAELSVVTAVQADTDAEEEQDLAPASLKDPSGKQTEALQEE